MTVERNNEQLVIRVSDHAEAYEPRGKRQISLSAHELTYADVVRVLDDGPQSIEKTPLRVEVSVEEKSYNAARDRRMATMHTAAKETLELIPLIDQIWFKLNGNNRPAARLFAIC